MSALSPIAAFLGGILTILAPCAVMVLPAFFSYAFQGARALIGRTALFWLGLVVALVPLGAAFGASGAFITEHLTLFSRIAAGVVIVFGLLEIFAIDIALPRFTRKETSAQLGSSPKDLTSPWAIFALGAGYGFAGIGCAGPILGAILVTAGFGASPAHGALLMVAYASGMAVPLLLLAALWKAGGLSQRAWMRPRPLRIFGRHTTWTNLVSGVLLVALGVAMTWSDVFANPLSALISPARLASTEEAIMRYTSAVPLWAILIALAAVLGAAWMLRPSPRPAPPDESD